MVSIYVGNTATLFPFFDAYVGGIKVATFTLRGWGMGAVNTNVGSSVTFVVPNGSNYNCIMSGNVAIYSWAELR